SEVEGRPAALAFLDNARAKVEKRVREHPNDDRFHRGLSRVQANLFFLEGGGRILLLRHESICDDLKLTTEQREKVAKITDDVHKNHEAVLKNLRDLDPAGQRSAFNKLIHENEATLESVLAPRQLQRLKQIDWQFLGPGAFGNPELVEALQLTASQRQQIQAI